MTKVIEYIEVSKLKFDLENPRLPISETKKIKELSADMQDKAIIEWMLDDASILELMLAIGQNDFFPGEALLVVKNNDYYIVVEGNRRLASLKLLNNPDLASIRQKSVAKVLAESKFQPKKVPCLEFDTRDDILLYLGYRHVTGVKSWGSLEKAKYITQLKENLLHLSIDEQSKILAKSIGSTKPTIKKQLIGYEMYSIIENSRFYKIPFLDDTTFHYNYIADSLNKSNIRNFLQIDLESIEPLSNLDTNNLEILIKWFFEKKPNGKTVALGNSTDLKLLDEVIGNESALEYLLENNNLKDAYHLVAISADTFHNDIRECLHMLKQTNLYIHKVENHGSTDIEILDELILLAKSMISVIEGK